MGLYVCRKKKKEDLLRVTKEYILKLQIPYCDIINNINETLNPDRSSWILYADREGLSHEKGNAESDLYSLGS